MPSKKIHKYDYLVPGFVSRLLQIGDCREAFVKRFFNGIQEVKTERDFPLLPNQMKAQHFDCILVNNISDLTDDLAKILESTDTFLNPYGVLSIIIPVSSQNGIRRDKVDDLLIDFGFLGYKFFSEKDLDGTGYGAGIVAVRNTYNPVLHARQIVEQEHFESAIEILDNIPDEFSGDMIALAHIATEKQQITPAFLNMNPPQGL
jgi:hypothetical protein